MRAASYRYTQETSGVVFAVSEILISFRVRTNSARSSRSGPRIIIAWEKFVFEFSFIQIIGCSAESEAEVHGGITSGSDKRVLPK